MFYCVRIYTKLCFRYVYKDQKRTKKKKKTLQWTSAFLRCMGELSKLEAMWEGKDYAGINQARNGCDQWREVRILRWHCWWCAFFLFLHLPSCNGMMLRAGLVWFNCAACCIIRIQKCQTYKQREESLSVAITVEPTYNEPGEPHGTCSL